MTWHLDEELARRYARGRVTAVLAASVEQHVVGCADCRALVGARADADRLDAVWAAVGERVLSPRPTLVERILRGLGVHESTARLVAVTPSLRGAWLTGVVVVLTLAIVAAHSTPRGAAFLLALAPVLPLVGVGFAFGPHSDPAHEMAAAAPYPTVRLLALRTGVVVASTLVPAVGASVLLPGSHWGAVAWLLPALAMTMVTVAASSRVPAHLTASVLSAGWLALVVQQVRDERLQLLTSPGLQATCLVVLLAAGAVLLTTAHSISPLHRSHP